MHVDPVTVASPDRLAWVCPALGCVLAQAVGALAAFNAVALVWELAPTVVCLDEWAYLARPIAVGVFVARHSVWLPLGLFALGHLAPGVAVVDSLSRRAGARALAIQLSLTAVEVVVATQAWLATVGALVYFDHAQNCICE
mgnify:CR=1 FL=1